MKKRILSLLLTAVMLLSVIPLAISAEPVSHAEGGNGDQRNADGILIADPDWYTTEKDLYIWDVSDMLAYADKLAAAGDGKSFFDGVVIHIKADIDMKEVSGLGWKGHIKRNRYFQGIIDGHGHTISNFKWEGEPTVSTNTNAGLLAGGLKAGTAVNETYGASAGVFDLSIRNSSLTAYAGCYTNGGLFGSVSGGDKNIKLKNLYVDIDVSSNAEYTGGLFGSVSGKNIQMENIYVDINASSNQRYLGGMIGSIPSTSESDIQIRNCVVTGNITATNTASGGFYAGGLIGQCVAQNKDASGAYQNGVVIENCAYYGTITSKEGHSTNGHQKIGGLIGSVDNGATGTTTMASIKNCIVEGSICFEGSEVIGNCGKLVGVGTSRSETNIQNVLVCVDVKKNEKSMTLDYYKGTTTTGAYIYTVKSLTGLEAQTLLNDISSGASDTPVALSEWTATTVGNPLPRTLVEKGIASVIGAGTLDSTTVLRGYQTRSGTDDTFDFRLVSTIKLPEGVKAADTNVTKVGYLLVANFGGKTLTKDYPTNTVYNAVSGNSETGLKDYTAEELGGDYLFAYTITGAPTDSEITLEVTTYYVDSDGNTVYGATKLLKITAPQAELK